MGQTPLSERQATLLAVVAAGGGDRDARRIDLTAGVRYGRARAREPSYGNSKNSGNWGWSSGTTAAPGPGRWKVTAAARPYLEDHDDVPRSREGGLD